MVTFHQPWSECANTHAHTLQKAPQCNEMTMEQTRLWNVVVHFLGSISADPIS